MHTSTRIYISTHTRACRSACMRRQTFVGVFLASTFDRFCVCAQHSTDVEMWIGIAVTQCLCCAWDLLDKDWFFISIILWVWCYMTVSSSFSALVSCVHLHWSSPFIYLTHTHILSCSLFTGGDVTVDCVPLVQWHDTIFEGFRAQSSQYDLVVLDR